MYSISDFSANVNLVKCPGAKFKSTVNYLNETVEGSIYLISKTSLIQKQKTNIFPNISQLMLDFINKVSNNVFN